MRTPDAHSESGQKMNRRLFLNRFGMGLGAVALTDSLKLAV